MRTSSDRLKKSSRRWKKKAAADELVLLYQDEGRFGLVPTLWRALGLKGHRLHVGTLDGKDAAYAFAAINAKTGRLTTRLQRWPARRHRPKDWTKNRILQKAFVRLLRQIARAYPGQRVVIVIDNAAWHGGEPVRAVLRAHPQLQLYRLPPYSPQLNKIERLWKVFRRRFTHNRLFRTLEALCQGLRTGFKCLRSTPSRLRTLLLSDRKRKRADLPAV